MNQRELQVNDIIYFYEDKKPYKIKACNEEFAILTKPFNLKHTCLYTICDWTQGKRNRNNMVFNPYDYMIQEDIEKCLTDLTNPKHVCNISHRGVLGIDITKIVRDKKIIYQNESCKMNKNQIGDMEHAIKNKRFYTDANDKDWNDLVEKGYATKSAGWDDDSAYFYPTSEGKAALKEILQ